MRKQPATAKTQESIVRFLNKNAGEYFTKNQIAVKTKLGSAVKYSVDVLLESGTVKRGEQVQVGRYLTWSDTFGIPVKAPESFDVDIYSIIKGPWTSAVNTAA